jgi:NAD-dependent DNA ligase
MVVDFANIKGFTEPAIKSIYEHFGDDLQSIEQASIEDLQVLPDIGPQIAECIHTYFNEPAYELWYNENIRTEKKGEFEVLQETLGLRIATILRANFYSIDKIRAKGIDNLAALDAMVQEEGKRHFCAMSHNEAERVVDYFHLTAYEFHSKPRKEPVDTSRTCFSDNPADKCNTKYKDPELNEILGVITGKDVENWREEVQQEDVFRQITYFDKYMCVVLQGENEITNTLMKRFLDYRQVAYTKFDIRMENEMHRDISEEDLIKKFGNSKIIDKLTEILKSEQ